MARAKNFDEKLRPGERTGLWLTRIVLWVLILVSVFPTLWVITASFQKGDVFFSNTLIPGSFTLDNYKKLFENTDFIRWVKNTIVIATTVSLLQVFQTAFAAYGFSRLKFRGRKYGLMGLLLLQMFPATMSLVAIYTILARLNLLDNLVALAFVLAGGSAFNIWMLKGYIDGLPRELDEAAMADGASHWQVFWRIIFPLAVPMLVVIFLWSFVGAYSEFTISSVVLKSPTNYSLAVGLQRFILNQFAARWTQFSAAALLSSLPVVLVWLLLQRNIITGMTRGAVKG